MRRLFWVSLGVGFGGAAGVLVARRIRRTREALTPESIAGVLAGAVGGLADGLRAFAAEVRAGMAEREAQLREGLGIDAAGES